MKLYDFELIKDGAVIAVSRSIPLPGLAEAWPLIETMASAAGNAGAKICVRDEDGGIVILTGVVSVLRMFAGRAAAE